MDIPYQIWLSIGFLTYYTTLQLYDDISKYSSRTDIKSRTIENFRSKYKVTVRTFRSSKPLYGFAWSKSIWVNDTLVKLKKPLEFTLHHEYYHLKHKHKRWMQFLRLVLSLTPLSMYCVKWYIFLIILVVSASIVDRVLGIFEDRANEYANKKLEECP